MWHTAGSGLIDVDTVYSQMAYMYIFVLAKPIFVEYNTESQYCPYQSLWFDANEKSFPQPF